MGNLELNNGTITTTVETKSTIEVQIEIEDTIDIDVSMENEEAIAVAMELSETEINANMDAAAHEVSSTKHNELQNKDLPNQHPISSITGLREELDKIKNNVVTSYNDLTDKPKINDVELGGNKTSEQLGINSIDMIDLEAILD